MSTPSSTSTRVAVVGGGLAGLAAGCALADAGFHITLFERRPYLGGRASSYEHPGTGEVVDNCQHVLLGCCTNLNQFYERLKVQDRIGWYDHLTFLEPSGRASVIASSWLPAPFHNTFSFLRASCLGLKDKLAIASAMASLAPKPPADTGQSFLKWLQSHHQTERAIERFWKTILVSALNEDLDRMSVPYAAQVIRESFLKSAAAGRMGVPTVPLTELYNAAGDYICARRGEVRLRSGVESSRAEPEGTKLYVGGDEISFDFVLFAVPSDALLRMLPQGTETLALRTKLAHFETSPITGIHLWFDRQITDLDHAVLLDRTIQWMFHKSKLLGRASQMSTSSQIEPRAISTKREGHELSRADNRSDGEGRDFNGNSRSNVEGHDFSRADSVSNQVGALAPEVNGSYVELVVSSSKGLVEKSKSEITKLALDELCEFFPQAKNAKLLKSTVIKEVNATFSPSPGIDAYRPTNHTAWPRIFLAGDWTATGWPATMEGAVRSGYRAAEALAKRAGKSQAKFLVPDLPAAGFMRLL